MGVGASPPWASWRRAVAWEPRGGAGRAGCGAGLCPLSGRGSGRCLSQQGPLCVADREAAQRAGDGERERQGDVGDADGAGPQPGRACGPGAATGAWQPPPGLGLPAPPLPAGPWLALGFLVTLGAANTSDAFRLDLGALPRGNLNRIAPLASVPSPRSLLFMVLVDVRNK